MAARARRRSHRLKTVDLDLHPNEASDLARIEDRALLRAQGWELGFWTVLDEGPIENCVAAVGRRRGGEHWEVARPRFAVKGGAGKTEDGEVCVVRDGWVNLIGSHYGSKEGPLEAKRAFLARFREDELGEGLGDGTSELQIARNRFRLHRAVNDALRAFGPELRPVGSKARKRFVARARKDAGRRRSGRINPTDVPLNVEGAAILPSGSLVLGLRYPVTADGDPILAELSGIEAMFEDERAAPVVRRFWTLAGAGSRRRPVGIRAMSRKGAELHAIVGSIEGDDPDSVLLQDDPAGGGARCSHHRFRLGSGRDGGPIRTELVRRFPLKNVEGLAPGPDGRFFYVTDEDDRVHVRYMHD
jgi:hypothetical protein